MENNKEENTLQIKKQASKGYVYHYKRSEHPLDRKKEKPKGLKGLFRNKALLLILCDIILIILIYYFVRNPLIDTLDNKSETMITIDNYFITLTGYRIKDRVFARLYIEKQGESDSDKPATAGVTFSVGDNSITITADLPERTGTVESEARADTLPGEIDEGVQVKATLESLELSDELHAYIRIGEYEGTLSLLPVER